MEKQLSLSQLEIFSTVAQKQSFTQAAQQLNLSKAAVSQAVKKLEGDMGVRLLIRSTRQIKLSEEGALLFEQCQRIKYELNAAQDLMNTVHKEPSGILRVSCNPLFFETYFLPKLIKYRAQFPKVSLDVILAEREIDLVSEQVDFALGACWPVSGNIVARHVADTRFVLCATPRYLQEHGTPTTLQDLKKHSHIAHMARVQRNSINTDQGWVATQTTMVIDKINGVKACVLNHLGIARFHRYVVADELNSGELIELLPEAFQAKDLLYIYYQKNRFVQPKLRQLVNLFFDKI